MTFSIIEDILKQYPQILSSGHIVIRSDNCSTQYKSCFTFAVMMQLAKKYGVTFTWFYGEPGHGRGLVDAMSSFGCKGPLKHAIITKDQWFSTAEEMSDFLKKFFNGDSTKHYHVIHEKDTAELRKAEKNEHKIAGSMKLHMVSVNKFGQWTKKVTPGIENENVFTLDFDENDTEDDLFDDAEACSDTEELENDGNEVEFELQNNSAFLKHDFVEISSFVGLKPPSSAFELFYLVKIINKGVAAEHLSDTKGHSIEEDQPYFISTYYEFLLSFGSFHCLL